jgi:hypothetical protein
MCEHDLPWWDLLNSDLVFVFLGRFFHFFCIFWPEKEKEKFLQHFFVGYSLRMGNYGEQVEGYPAEIQIPGQYTLIAFIVFLLTLEKLLFTLDVF